MGTRKIYPAIHIRITDDERAKLDEIERVAHIRDSALTHAFISALIEHWEKYREIRLPFRLSYDEAHEFHANAHGATAKIRKPAK
jgi:hypothetical protein